MKFEETYRAESGEALVANVGLHWVETHHDHVDAQIKLDAVEEERGLQVSLHDDIATLKGQRQVFKLLKYRDVVTLRAYLRLCNEDCFWMLLLVLLESPHILVIR